MFNFVENNNPWINRSFGVNANVQFNLAGTNNVALAGGLQDSDSATASLQEFIPEVWGASIQDYMEKNLVFAKLATDQSAMVAGGGDRIHLPRHTELTASDTYGGGTVAVETLIDTNLAFAKSTDAEDAYTLDINQAIHSAISITDVAKVQSSYDVMNLYTSKLGYALAKKIDAYVGIKLFEEVAFNYANGTDDGNQAGNTIEINTTHDSYNIIAAGVSNLVEAVHTNDSNLEDWTMVLVPKCYASLFKLADFARYDGIGNSFGGQVPTISGYAGKLAGIDVVVNNNFQHYGAASSTQAQSATPVGNFSANGVSDESEVLLGYLVHKDALHIAYSSGMKARVQSDYHLPSLSTRFVADSVYGCLATGNTTDGNKKVFAIVSPAS
tara:strand:+ start:1072 stop:2223 length:1152 start_codon:yes stop_codon:yes gene_type:complete